MARAIEVDRDEGAWVTRLAAGVGGVAAGVEAGAEDSAGTSAWDAHLKPAKPTVFFVTLTMGAAGRTAGIFGTVGTGDGIGTGAGADVTRGASASGAHLDPARPTF